MIKTVAFWVASSLPLVLVACDPARKERPAESSTACSPTYLEIASDPETVVSVGAVLIGCKRDLDALTDAERRLLHSALHEIAGELHFGILACAETDVRAKLTGRLNKRLGRSIMTDIYCFEASVGDYFE